MSEARSGSGPDRAATAVDDGSTPGAETERDREPPAAEEASTTETPDAEQRAELLRSLGSDLPEGETPDLMQLVGRLRGPLGVIAVAALGLFLVAFFAALKAARPFVLPVVGAVLLNFFLTPVVRFLRRSGVPSAVGAGMVLIALAGATGFGVYHLTQPASEWMQEASRNAWRIERELRGLRQPVEEVQQAVKQVEEAADTQDSETRSQQVSVRPPSASESLVSQARAVTAGVVVMFFLLFFLLASGELFLRKLARVLPSFRHRRTAVEIVRRTESQVSTYLFTMAMINAGLGVVVGVAMWLLEMPNPILWGVMAGTLNFIPYIGPLVGQIVTGMVALVTFESTGRALLVPTVYLALNALEGYLVTPMIMGRRLTLNPVAIFVSVIFWGWLWGIPGALLAVPLLAVFKIVCDNIEILAPVGEFLAA